ncbi:MAG: hypothetical protein ACWGN7_01780 [Thermodesulfovibrionales bacterium]
MASSDGRAVLGRFEAASYCGVTSRQARLHEYLSRSESSRTAEEPERVRGLIPQWLDVSQSRLLSVLMMEERHADVESLVLAFEEMLLDGDDSL